MRTLEVRLKGLEPSRPKAPDPKSGVSTNSTTTAASIRKIFTKVQKS